MASGSTQRPSSSSSSSLFSSPFDSQWSWDVFLSFRGEDTRRGFTDHLYSALNRCNIKTFRDDEGLRKGEEIAPDLLQAIQESRIAVIVFSKTYAHSRWCLEELVKIVNCKDERGQKVIPIFYHVDPSQVRNQDGIFEEPFAHHQENADEEKKGKIGRWKTAMTEAANLAGYHVKDSYESKIIDGIIEEIHGIIPKVLYVNKNIVGMDSRLETLISLLKIQFNDVRMIGVYGIGGVGKTTIITALHNKISKQFKCISFLTNIREESTKDSGLLKLQQQLLDDTLGEKGRLNLKNIQEGVEVIKDRLSSKKVLVFLDDIDNLRQLEHLVGEHVWFGPGSRIIITTRRKDLLTRHGVDYMYEVDKLNIKEALQLFCSYAFKQHLPGKGFGDLSTQVIQYADGLPLVLKVLGSLLFRKEVKDWKSELKKLEEVPNMEITNVLKISYDGLDDMQKMIFLDIACFFRGQHVEPVTAILEGSGFNAESGINALVDRCFITILRGEYIEMHDSLAQMGKDIVCKECLNEPGERSRLWRNMDVCRVLTKNTGTEKIEGIVLHDESPSELIKFTAKAFERMSRLRVLDIYYKHVQISEDFAFPSYDLTSLKWDGYSLPSLPSNFHANNLVHLCLWNSNIKQLWKGNLCLKRLKRLIMDGSEQLIQIPQFSTMPNLEYLYLSGCVNLESLPDDIHKLKHLLLLHCDGCSKLTSFPKLKRSIGKLQHLALVGTAIKELPASIELFKGLRGLDLTNCKNLESLPNSICNLSCLVFLNLDGCSKLGKLPEDLERMPCLQLLSLKSIICRLPSLSGLSHSKVLCLDQCDLTPEVIKRDNRLHALELLSLRNCNIINEGEVFNGIFHLRSLNVLDLSGCNTEEGGMFLNDLLVGITQLSNLRALCLSHCKKLPQIPELPSSLRLLNAHSSKGTSLPPMNSLVNCLKSANQDLEFKRSSEKIDLTDCSYHGEGICIVLHGSSGIPEWIGNQDERSCIEIKLPKVWYENNEFLGVALCCVYVPLRSDSAHESEIESDNGSGYETDEIEFDEDSPINACETEYAFTTELQFCGDEYGSPPMCRQYLEFRSKCNRGCVSEQMWVTLYPKVALTEIYSYCSNQFTSLLAQFSIPNRNWEVLRCGFQPIYAYDDPTRNVDVDVSCCFDCQRNVENRKLCLKGQPINQLPWETVAVDTLCLRDCKNLETLPTSIWDSKSLKSLFCTNCSQLRSFPLVLTNVENLRELHLNGTAIKELSSSIEHLSRLEILNLAGCQELVTLPESICNLSSLQSLNVSYCSKLRKLPQNLGRLKRLKFLSAFGLNSMCCQLLSLSGLCSLKSLYLSDSMVMRQGVIMSDICCLYSLKVLDLSSCKLDEGGIPSEICRLSSLVKLSLNANRFRSIPSWISQLSMLRFLDLGHCPSLVQIAELPSSLRVLNVHGCGWLGASSPPLSSSLFKCFQSVIQDFECRIDVGQLDFINIDVIISGSIGIPKWIRPQKKGFQVVAKLPQDWYKDGDFLGFVLYSIYINESKAEHRRDQTSCKCELTLLGNEHQLAGTTQFKFNCRCSEVMWMCYYPKVAIDKKNRSNRWKQLKASFYGFSYGKAMEVEECGIHLIYDSHAHEHVSASAGKSLIPNFCQACQLDDQSGSQLKLSTNEDDINECSLQPGSFCVPGCKNHRSLPSELKSLTPLLCLGYPGLRNFPKTLQDVENLKQLHLDGTAIEEVPASIQHLKGLQLLNFQYCNNLVSLPESICNLKSLNTLSCLGCSSLREFPEIREDMKNLIQLYLGESAIEALPSSIQNLRGLQILNLSRCNNLRSLPSTICELKSLVALFCSGCSQLRSFPEILGDMGNLKGLYLDGTAIEELPESIQHLQGLQYLDLENCNNLVCLPENICYLKSLITLACSSCSNLRVFPDVSKNMENLRDLKFSGTSIKELPSSIEHLGGLHHLYLENCSNLVKIPESISKLSSLKELRVDFCTELEKFPDNLGSLQCLEALGVSGLNLSMDCFSRIAADIIQLSKLRILDLSHCPKLGQVPDLPPTLRFLDVHNILSSSLSRLLGFSLLKCFKSAIEELECGSYWDKAIRVLTSGNDRIPEWIRHREKGSQITVELPPDWHKNNDFLGFVAYSVFIPSPPGSLNCKLDFCGDGGSGCWDVDNVEFSFCEVCVGSIQMCVAYYPKLAIEKHYWSNKWRRLKASFQGSDQGSPVEVKECGIHLIYTQDIPEDTDAHGRWDKKEGIMEHNDQLLMIEYNDEQRSCDTESAADNATVSVQTSNHNIQFTEHNTDPPMDMKTENVSNYVVEAQDDEEDRMDNWLKLLFNFVQRICCSRRY